MTAAPFLLAALAALAPPAALGWAIARGRPRIGLLAAAALLGLGPWLVAQAVDPVLAEMRAGWLPGTPHDWSALDQPGRKLVIDGIHTRLAHGKLVAGLPMVAGGLAGAGVALLTLAIAYRRWQAARQPRLD